MNNILWNHRWMYDRCYNGRSDLKESFVEGVEQFISKASQQDCYNNDGGIKCPCVKCDCTRILEDRVVKDHGEEMSQIDLNEGTSYMDASTSAEYVGQHEKIMLMQDMMCDALRQP